MSVKKFLSLAFAALLFGASASWAAPVGNDRASKVAINYVNAIYGQASGLSVKSVQSLSDGLLLVNLAPKGFVIVASDDCVDPIMGYSIESNLDPNRLPDNLAYMLSETTQAVSAVKARGNVNTKWAAYERGSVRLSRAIAAVEPLITVNWNQGNPYNKYCPEGNAGKAIVGCVAVAMSQAMSVKQYPPKPMGKNSYSVPGFGTVAVDYDKEDAYDWDAIMQGTNKYDETARLLFHAGVSVNMDYGVDGSGIPSNQVYRITNGFKNVFGYPDVEYFWHDEYRGDWDELIYNELIAGRAVVYNAIDSKNNSGHSFNVDGHDGVNLYHVNWGWGGYGNGYFGINNLKDAYQGFHFDIKHVAVIGIERGNTSIHSLRLSDMVIEEDTPVGTPIAAVIVNGKMVDESEVKIEIRSGDAEEVPFTYSKGILSTKTALTAGKEVSLIVKATYKADNSSLTQFFTIEVTPPQALESRSAISYDRESKTFAIKSKFGTSYVVKNAQGAVVAQGTFAEEPQINVLRSALSAGVNTVELTNGSKSKTLKIKL